METSTQESPMLDDERARLAHAIQPSLEQLVRALARLERLAEPENEDSAFTAVDENLSAVHAELQRAPAAIREEPGPQIIVEYESFAPWPIHFGEVMAQLEVTTEKLQLERRKLRGTDRSGWRRLTREFHICRQILEQFLADAERSSERAAAPAESAPAEISPRVKEIAIEDEAAGEDEEQLSRNCRKVLLWMLKNKVFANNPLSQATIANGAKIGETKVTFKTLRDRGYIIAKHGGGTHLTSDGKVIAEELQATEDIH